jgi:hypothetical protein
MSPHVLYGNGPFADGKKTLPQYCCVGRVLECAHWAAAQQCLKQIRHNIVDCVLCAKSYSKLRVFKKLGYLSSFPQYVKVAHFVS